MKQIELKRVAKSKIGKYSLNGIKVEKHEIKTMKHLVLYGFNISTIRPTNVPKIHNPDIFMSGSIWEIKAPISYNEEKLKNKMKKASKQATGHVIFDLRNMKADSQKTESYIIKLFQGNNRVKRMIVITKDRRVIDFSK